ncbi:hypothetical protein D3C80_1755610 [compost metagenome]
MLRVACRRHLGPRRGQRSSVHHRPVGRYQRTGPGQQRGNVDIGFASGKQHTDRRAHFHFAPRFDQDLAEHRVFFGCQFDQGLFGLDLGNAITGADAVAFLEGPVLDRRVGGVG